MKVLPKGFETLVRLTLVMMALIASAYGDAVSDVMVGYSATWRAGMGGTDQTNAAIYNQFGGANGIAAGSGSPHRLNVIATKESAHDPTNEVDCGGMIGWLRDYDVRVRDVVDVGNYLGADLFTYIGDMYNNGAAAQAEQPGRFSCYEQQWFWQNVVAHETGGHNFGCDHAVGHNNPTTIMLHNYCGGSQPFYSNPNTWLNGVKLLGDGSCIGYLASGGDAAYLLSTTAQGRADIAARRVWGSWLGAPKYRWQFNKPAGSAPAGTAITDEVSGAVATVRGQGATYTGTGLRLPGGTSGNIAANSIAAYLDLPNGLFSAMPNFTIEIWATPQSAKDWMRVIEIGRTTQGGDVGGTNGEWGGLPNSVAPGATDGSDVLGLSACTWTGGLNSQRFLAGVDGTHQIADSTLGTTAGEMHHYAITFADATTGATVKWFRDGTLIKTLNVPFHSAALEDVNIWLGRSLWSGDQMANIDYHDVRIQSAAIADAEVAGNYRMGPNNQKVTLWANDAYGSSGFVTGAWEGQATPDASHDYEVGTLLLRTPLTSTNVNFPGRSLTITGGTLHLNATGPKTTTINDLRLKGATVGSFGEGDSTQTLAGQIKLSTWDINQIRGSWGEMVISSAISTVAGTGNGILLFTEKAVTLTGNNSGYTGAMWVGDGRFSTLRISSETNLGSNPPWYGGDWLSLNRGILETTQTMTIDDANRGVRIGPSGGFFKPWANTTLTIATPITSPAAGNVLQTAPMDSNPIAGIFFKDDWGQLNLTNPNNSHNGEIQILKGELMLSGNGRLNNGDHWMPFLDNGLFTCNSNLDQTVRGTISGTGSLVKGGNGTLYLPTPSTLSGTVTVNGGTLYANSGNAAINRVFSYVNSITINGGTLRCTSNSLFGWDGTQEKAITVNTGGTLASDGGADVGVGSLTLAGGTLANLGTSADWGSWRFDQSTDALNATADSIVSASNVKFGNAAAAINVSPGKTLNFTGTITNTNFGGISYLTKTGTGVLTLAGANTYTGATAVNAGTLNVTGSLGATAVSVAGGATLKGVGSIGGNVTFATNAIHTPGTGTQSITGAASYANGSRFKWTLSSNSNSAGVASRASVTGAVTVTSGAAIDLVLNDAGSSANYFDAFWTQSRSWTVVSSGGGMTGQFTLGTIGNDAQGKAASVYGTFALVQNSSGATLQWTPKAFAAWRGTSFGANATDVTTSDFGSDPDKDGLANAWEYFYYTNPSANTSAPFQARIENNRVKLTFPRNISAVDALVKIQAADSPGGPWTDMAQSSGGAAFSPIVGGATVTESGSGQTRAVEFNDSYLTTDPGYPKRFFRLWIQQQ